MLYVSMERRKQKIFKQLDVIQEEQSSMVDIIQLIVEQISSCLDSKSLRQKDLSEIFCYEIDVIKKLHEINIALESLAESNPINKWGITSKGIKFKVKLEAQPKVEINTLESTTFENNPQLLNNSISAQHVLDHSSTEETNDVLVLNNVNQLNITDFSIQSVRETMKKIAEKLEINEPNMCSLKNYYEKASSSSFSVHPAHPSTVEPTNSQISDDFEVPERDTSSCSLSFRDVSYPTPCTTTDTATLTTSTKDKQYNKLYCQLNSDIAQGTLHTDDPSTSESNLQTNNSDQIQMTSSSAIDKLNNYSYINDECGLLPNLVKEPVLLQNESVATTNSEIQEAEEIQTLLLCNVPEKLSAVNTCKDHFNLPEPSLKPDVLTKSMKEENDLNQHLLLGYRDQAMNTNENTGEPTLLMDMRPKNGVKAGDICAFCHIESPSEFYIHICDEETEVIDKLTEDINGLFNQRKNYSSKEAAQKQIGRYCVAFVAKYKNCYRAKVLDWHMENESEEVDIQLVDYGNKCKVAYNFLMQISGQLCTIPKLAVKCHLPLMYPPGSTHSERRVDWPVETIDGLLSLSGLAVGEDKLFEIVYTLHSDERESFAVDMYNIHEHDREDTVGQILLDMKLAVQLTMITDVAGYTDIEAIISNVDLLEEFENINEAIAGYDARDEARICRFTKPDGTCYKGKHCKLEHARLPKDGFTTDKEEVFTEAMYDLELPKVGNIVTILITGYINSCNFFVNIIRTPYHKSNYIVDKDFELLLEDMNDPKTVRTYTPFKMLPTLGEVVLVKHWSNKWYRGVVRQSSMTDPYTQDCDIEVFTVDFGDTLKVGLRDIRKIKPHFLKLPFQAVHCYLDNYRFLKNCNKEASKDFFMKNLHLRNFVGESLSRTLPLKMVVTTFDGRNIGDVLVQRGFAEHTQKDDNPMDGSILMM